MNQSKPISLFLTFVVAMILSSDTFALSIAIDTEEHIERSEVIAIGKVVLKTGKEMNWIHRNYDERIFTLSEVMTEYEIEVSRILKGEYKARVITIYGFGGVVGDRETNWSFGFNIELDDVVLLFLHKNPENDLWTVVGQSQGVFKLQRIDDSLRVVNSVQEHLSVEGGTESAGDHQRLKIKELENLIREKE